MTVLFLRGGLASTAIAPMEVFRSAGVVWNQLRGTPEAPRFRVRTVSVDGRPVACDGPLRIAPDGDLGSARQIDLIVVPATGVMTDALLKRHAKVVPWLRRWHRRGCAIAGICSGVALLAEAGLLDGRPATTHWGLVDAYRERYPRVDWQPELFVTEADDVFCGGGVYASLDLSLHLVERYAGREVAVQCAKALLIDAPRTWQSGYAALPRRAGHADEQIRRAQEWLHANFRGQVRVDALAGQLGMSPRNLARRFKGATGKPLLAYLHELRVAAAKQLLERDYRTVQEIGCEVGYDDLAFFRSLFKRHVGLAPQVYRERFGRSARARP